MLFRSELEKLLLDQYFRICIKKINKNLSLLQWSLPHLAFFFSLIEAHFIFRQVLLSEICSYTSTNG